MNLGPTINSAAGRRGPGVLAGRPLAVLRQRPPRRVRSTTTSTQSWRADVARRLRLAGADEPRPERQHAAERLRAVVLRERRRARRSSSSAATARAALGGARHVRERAPGTTARGARRRWLPELSSAFNDNAADHAPRRAGDLLPRRIARAGRRRPTCGPRRVPALDAPWSTPVNLGAAVNSERQRVRTRTCPRTGGRSSSPRAAPAGSAAPTCT